MEEENKQENTEEIKEEEIEGNVEEESEDTEDQKLEESNDLIFPLAPITREIRRHSEGKMISSKVKVATNMFLSRILTLISKDMANTRYAMIEMDDFRRATLPYTFVKQLDKEKERIIVDMEKMRMDWEAKIEEFKRKFGKEEFEV
ncbi:MAG: hypothetical protein DRN66_03185 [Candidatus Nanohalarchaeota archaeon]|nr:MAG: hypothetical protein DRN66_03185 [Candidatus Nanohaloarchaeota archaeon]